MARKRKRPKKRGKRSHKSGPHARALFLAKKGNPEAQCRLGEMYLAGEGGARHDPERAVEWFRAAAEQGHASAQVYLGDAYYDGDVVVQDSEEAVRWYRAAAKAGHQDAPLYLGMLYGDLEVDMDDDPDAERYLESL